MKRGVTILRLSRERELVRDASSFAVVVAPARRKTPFPGKNGLLWHRRPKRQVSRYTLLPGHCTNEPGCDGSDEFVDDGADDSSMMSPMIRR